MSDGNNGLKPLEWETYHGFGQVEAYAVRDCGEHSIRLLRSREGHPWQLRLMEHDENLDDDLAFLPCIHADLNAEEAQRRAEAVLARLVEVLSWLGVGDA